MPTIRQIVPCLWFDGQAEDAATFYVYVFERSRINRVSRYTDAGREFHGRPAGSIMAVAFELEGQPFTALNGGPQFKFNEAISLQVMCETQSEVDRYWEKLTLGGDEASQQSGWVKDKFGVSWQIVPTLLPEWLADADTAKASRTMNAMLRMKKLDIAALKKAHAG